MSADIGICPPVTKQNCPLMAIRPLSVICIRTSASAAYRHFGGGSGQRVQAWPRRPGRRTHRPSALAGNAKFVIACVAGLIRVTVLAS